MFCFCRLIMNFRRRTLEILLLLTLASMQEIDASNPCGNTDARVSVENVTEEVEFQLPNRSDLSSHQISVTFKWDLSVENEQTIDGFLYKFYDTDENAYNSISKRSLPRNMGVMASLPSIFPDLIPDIFIMTMAGCQKYWKKPVWTMADNGTYVQCLFPCSDHFKTSCLVPNSLCTKLGDGYNLLRRDVRKMTFEISYGRHYSFEIAAYRKHSITQKLYSNKEVFLFCGEHLIKEVGIDRMLAYQYCSQAQNISELSTVSSAVSDLEVYKFTPDYERNKVNATVRWRAPHDVIKGQRIKKYILIIQPNPFLQTMVHAKTPEEEAIDPFYNVTISNLNFNETFQLRVLPYVNRNVDVCIFHGSCSEYGNSASIEVVVSDVDGCIELPWSDEQSFCVDEASCTDLGPDSHRPANCSCGKGYHGNGVRPIWTGGTGCIDINDCSNYYKFTYICHKMAVCVDNKAPETGFACRCQDGYFGDGLKEGSGCTNRNLVVGLAVGIPLGLTLLLCTVVILRKHRIIKKRDIIVTPMRMKYNKHSDLMEHTK